MSEKLTRILLPGSKSSGFMDWDEQTAEDMIKLYRSYAERQIAEGQEVLAASDADFKIDVILGPLVQKLVRPIQPGRPKP